MRRFVPAPCTSAVTTPELITMTDPGDHHRPIQVITMADPSDHDGAIQVITMNRSG